jgi:cytochrome c biogenesis factor
MFNFIFFFKKKKFFLNSLIFTTYQMDTLKLAILIQFSIFLGGWWAQLELHWGGW